MSTYSQFFGGNYVRKTQTITASGTWTPTQGLLDAGGIIDVDMRGGGGGGTNVWDVGGAGGDSRHVIQYQVTTLTPITVTIGAAGTYSYPTANSGGATTFGTVTVAGGGAGTSQGGGNGSGNMGKAGQPTFNGTNNSWSGPARILGASNGTDYGQGGFGAGVSGQPGVVILTWIEKA